MLRDLAEWLLYSPRRLLGLVIPAAVLALIGTAALDSPEDVARTGAETQPPAAPLAPGPTTLADPETHTEHAAPASRIRRTALNFLQQYVAPPDEPPAAVPTGLERLTTPSLWRGLHLTTPALLPQGVIEELKVEEAGAFSGLVQADLNDDSSLAVSVVAWERGWRVSDVRPGDQP